MKVLLLHGLGDDHTAWHAVLPHIEELDCEAVDLPGFGGCSWRGDPLEEVARSLLPSEPTVVVGHSMGGVVATLMAESESPFIRGVVNIEGNLTRAGCFLSGRAVAADDFDMWFGVFQRKWKGTRYGVALENCDPQAFLACSQDLVRLSEDDALAARYRSLQVQRTYVYGTSSITEESLAALGDEQSVALEAGHWVAEDAPAELARALRDFVAKVGQ